MTSRAQHYREAERLLATVAEAVNWEPIVHKAIAHALLATVADTVAAELNIGASRFR